MTKPTLRVYDYKIPLTAKWWYWSLFTNLLDVTMVNASILAKKANKNKMDLLEFKRYVATSYLKRNGVLKKTSSLYSGRKVSVLDNIRYEGVDHSLCKRTAQNRCQAPGCTGRPLSYCEKCQVTLCINCFLPFHTKWFFLDFLISYVLAPAGIFIDQYAFPLYLLVSNSISWKYLSYRYLKKLLLV